MLRIIWRFFQVCICVLGFIEVCGYISYTLCKPISETRIRYRLFKMSGCRRSKLANELANFQWDMRIFHLVNIVYHLIDVLLLVTSLIFRIINVLWHLYLNLCLLPHFIWFLLQLDVYSILKDLRLIFMQDFLKIFHKLSSVRLCINR